MRLLVAFCLALCTAAAFAGTAGQVMFAYGETHALRSGRIIQLRAGSEVDSGDQLHTGIDSYLQIRFTDWGVMSLRPRTDFVIDQYVYEAHAGGIERAFFSLLNGGVRSLTGLIGRRNHDHYRMRTSTTSIGIRGTNYAVLICNQDCKLDDGSLGEDGVYGGVTEGRIAVSPYGGAQLEREFGAGEYFRVPSANAAPERFSVPPTFFWDRREPQARAGGNTFAGTGWKPSPGAPSEGTGSVAAGEPTGTAGSLVRTDGSLTLSPITAPVLSPIATPVRKTGAQVGTTLGALSAPVVNGVVQPVTGALTTTLANGLAPVNGIVVSTLPAVGTLVSPLGREVVLPAAELAGSIVNSALSMPGQIAPLAGSALNAVPVLVAPVVTTVGGVVNTVVPVVPPVTVPPVAVPPVAVPPVTVPPVTVPPVTVPPVTVPPVAVPPVAVPPVAVPPVTVPPVAVPPVAVPPVTVPPVAVPPVTVPPVAVPPVTVPPVAVPPVAVPPVAVPPVTVPPVAVPPVAVPPVAVPPVIVPPVAVPPVTVPPVTVPPVVIAPAPPPVALPTVPSQPLVGGLHPLLKR